MTETNVEVQSAFFVDSLEEASVGVSGLFEERVSLLPVDVSGELLGHGFDEVHGPFGLGEEVERVRGSVGVPK